MKTRILHTRFWQDNFVCSLSKNEKLLFIYLLTNDKIGLTGIYECPDKFIRMELELTEKELNMAKDKFQKSGKFYFDNGWIVTVNVNKYNNYVSSPKVKMAYNKELKNVPEKLKKFALTIQSKEYKDEYVKSNSTYKHIVIAEAFLRRKLTENEIIHHIDEDPSNNDPTNLAIMDRDKHTALHKGEIELKDTSMILVSDLSDTPNNHKSKTINHKEGGIRGGKPLDDITDEDIQKIATDYRTTEAFVRSKIDDIKNYCGSTGKQYKNYLATLRNWVKKDALEILSQQKGGGKNERVAIL